MDSLLGVRGKDFVLLAADRVNAYSVLKLKQDDDKIWALGEDKLLAMGGEQADILVFGNYIQKNLRYLQLKNGHKLSGQETAQFIRSELAEAIRKGPYSVNCLLAAFEEGQPKLYWIDYLGSVVEVQRAAHGYAQMFVASTMDFLAGKQITLPDALLIMEKCFGSLRNRFLVTQTDFVLKLLTKDGIKILQQPSKQ